MVRLEGLRKLKKFNDLIDTRTRDLPVCSLAPLPSTLRIWRSENSWPHWDTTSYSSVVQPVDSRYIRLTIQNYICWFEVALKSWVTLPSSTVETWFHARKYSNDFWTKQVMGHNYSDPAILRKLTADNLLQERATTWLTSKVLRWVQRNKILAAASSTNAFMHILTAVSCE
jgi:hypothetical protein